MMRKGQNGYEKVKHGTGKKEKRKACVIWCLRKNERFRETELVKRKKKKGNGLRARLATQPQGTQHIGKLRVSSRINSKHSTREAPYRSAAAPASQSPPTCS